jgi:hypothetical protein
MAMPEGIPSVNGSFVSRIHASSKSKINSPNLYNLFFNRSLLVKTQYLFVLLDNFPLSSKLIGEITE